MVGFQILLEKIHTVFHCLATLLKALLHHVTYREWIVAVVRHVCLPGVTLPLRTKTQSR